MNSSTFYVAFYISTNNSMRLNENLVFFENDFEDNVSSHKMENASGYQLAASARQELNTTYYTVNLNLTIQPLFSNSENSLPPNVSCEIYYHPSVTNEPINVEIAHHNLGG